MTKKLQSVMLGVMLAGTMGLMADAAESIPTGAKVFNGHSYYLYDFDSNWSEAKAYCESLGGHLAVITSEAEDVLVKSLLDDCKYAAYWLGASRTNDGWQWINGEAFSYDGFWSDQPDETEAGMVLQMWNRGGSDWGWDDTWNEGDRGSGERMQGFVCEWETASSQAAVSKKITLKNIAGAKNSSFSYTAEYKDGYFEDENSQETAKKGLTRLSALGAMATYSSSGKNNALAFLKKCGFNDREKVFTMYGNPNGHSTRTDFDNGTLYCGWKDLNDGSRLFAFVISGYSKGGYEWVSNFKLGTSSVHAGFDTASSKMVSIMKDYMDQHNERGKLPKVWAMGHSRGGALTNLTVLKLMDDEYVKSWNVYAYGFATPQYMTKNIAIWENCIFNYISPHDFVPCVAPAKWNYHRTGCDFVFKNEKKMKKLYKSYTGHSYRGYTKAQKDSIVKAFAAFGKSQSKYANGYKANKYSTQMGLVGAFVKYPVYPQDYGMYGIGMAMSKNKSDSKKGVAKMLSTPDAQLLTLRLGWDKTFNNINDSHEMLAYLAWIDANMK